MANPYLTSKVMTADRGQLLLMLYDGAIRFNEQAVRHLDAGEIVPSLTPMRRTLAIVQELHNMLDASKAPELCANLERIYIFMQDQILDAQVRKTAEPLKVVSQSLKELRQSWGEAVTEVNRGKGGVRRAG